MRGKKRPQAERARAVGIAAVTSIAEASRQTGIPEPTINAWYHSPEFEELRARTKDQVAEEWWAGVQRGMRAVIREFESDAPLRDKAVAVGVLFDKLALMRGDATTRTEHRSVTHEFNDNEKRKLRDFVDGLPAVAPEQPADEGGDPSRTGAEVR